MLYLVFERITGCFKGGKPKSEADDINQFIAAICQITVLLHFLSCLWIYVGSEAYLDHEEDYLPW